MKKKTLTLVLGMALVIQMIFPDFVEASTDNYRDIPNNWAKSAVEYNVSKGYMTGYNGSFSPNKYMTRAEFAVTLVRIVKPKGTASLDEFKDLDKEAWYYKELSMAVHEGIVKGDGNTFRPNSVVTREEAFVMLSRTFKLENKQTGSMNKFKDGASLSNWAKDSAESMISSGFIAGSEGALKPKKEITRAEVAQILFNMRDLHEQKKLDESTVSDTKNTKNSSSGGSSRSGGGSSSGGGSNNSGSGSNSGGVSGSDSTVKEEQKSFISRSELLKIEEVHYAIFELKEGKQSDYTFKLGNVDIAPTPVNDQQTILKHEVNPLEKNHFIISKGVDSTNIDIGSGSKEFTQPVIDKSPKFILTNGAISYTDFNSSNYDKNGNIRFSPRKTTYDTVAEGKVESDQNIPKITVPEKVSLGDDIKLNFEADSAIGAQWQKGIISVKKDNGTSIGSRQNLQFSVADGEITVKGNSPPLLGKNGIHNIVISSQGFNDVYVKVHLVKPTGTIRLSGDFNYWAHQNLLFELNNFNYGTVNPIHTIILDGVKLQDGSVDYYVISNLIRLENQCLTKLTPGKHTLIVKAVGYEDFAKTFILEEAPSGFKNPMLNGINEDKSFESQVNYDVVTHATGSSGSNYVNAFVLFDYDLIANANILKALDKETSYSRIILNWWDSMKKDSIITPDGLDIYIDYAYFKDNCGSQSGEGTYVTFADLYDKVKNDNEFTEPRNPNRPYQIRNMLEDGLLGEKYYGKEASAKPSPDLTCNKAYLSDDVVIKFSDIADTDEWIDAITDLRANVGLQINDYVLDNVEKTITVSNSDRYFRAGSNTVTVLAEGYKTSTVAFTLSKRNDSELKVIKDGDGNIVISGLTEEYANSINEAILNGKSLLTNQQGGSGGHYEVRGSLVILYANLFDSINENQQYVLSLYGKPYETATISFTPLKCPVDVEAALSEVPSYVILDEKNKYRANKEVNIIIGKRFSESYLKKISKVTVNNKEVSNTSKVSNSLNYLIDGSIFTDEGKYTIQIHAEGYKVKMFEVEIVDIPLPVPSYVKASNQVEVGKDLIIYLKEFGSSDYYKAIASISIDDVIVDESKYNKLLNNYFTVKFDAIGKYNIIIKSKGYEDVKLPVEVVAKNVSYVVKLVEQGRTINEDKLIQETATDVKIVVGMSLGSEYEEALTKITVNGADISDITIAYEPVGYGRYAVLTIPSNTLIKGDNMIILHANNYKDKQFTVTVNN